MSSHLTFANTNSLWGSFLAETLSLAGVKHAVLCPGSRSAPLTCALAGHPRISAIPILDERSASFFALGLAKKTRMPVVLVCTSGTAAANFFPAVIEARESGVPLLVLTADRPPEMRDCSSGQTIDQLKIFGNYPRWQMEMALPEPTLMMLAYLRQTLRHACDRALSTPGPVHLNCPFRDPLAPIPDDSLDSLDKAAVEELLTDFVPVTERRVESSQEDLAVAFRQIGKAERVLLVAGPAGASRFTASTASAIFAFADQVKAPLLADLLSQLREQPGSKERTVDCYDRLLASGRFPESAPDLIIRLGALPTSKRLRQWLEGQDCPQIVIDPGDQNLDPLHSRCWHLRADVETTVAALANRLKQREAGSGWRRSWLERNEAARVVLDEALAPMTDLFEGKLPWLLARHTPAEAQIFISNSTPVRDAEFFWPVNELRREIFFNRGANGIDGIVSTAMGIASESRSTFLITGDLAFLHDQNGLLNSRNLKRGLTILLINNGGGGIFQSLPIAQFDPPFRDFFQTPQAVNFSLLCLAHGLAFEEVTGWERLIKLVEDPIKKGVRVIEIRTDAEASRLTRKRLLSGENERLGDR